ncbi:MAG: hypothetical protein QOJ46_560 [bacterium]
MLTTRRNSGADADHAGISRPAASVAHSARSAQDFATLREDLDAYRDLRIDAATLAAAESAQRGLAERGRQRVALPDLLIGACAQQHGADVLHVDRHFDLLATILGFRSIRLAW